MAISKECGRVNAADTTNGTSLSHLTTLAHFATAMFLNLTCQQGKSGPFVNYADGFALHNPEMSDLTGLFWKQLEWIQPESFIADGGAYMTFVSRNESIFVATCNALKDLGDRS
jgi:hypothetical protein